MLEIRVIRETLYIPHPIPCSARAVSCKKNCANYIRVITRSRIPANWEKMGRTPRARETYSWITSGNYRSFQSVIRGGAM